MTNMENLIDACGGFGKYQIFLIIGIFSHKLSAGWSMLQMAFGNFIPDWFCEVGPDNGNRTYFGNDTFMTCTVNNSDTGFVEQSCQNYVFVGHLKTVVSEWGLVCDRTWTKTVITSIQMAGVLVGAMSSGQLADTFGRKKAVFGYSIFHTLLNFAAAFSTSWEMFAVFRFLIGIGCGALLTVTFPYPMEFMPTKWRPLLAVLPDWVMGISCFALAAYFLENWSYLHIGCGIFSFPPMLGIFHVPESVRWLTLKGRYEEAEKIFEKMASVNGRSPPKQIREVLENIYQEEKMSRTQGRQYTYWDLFKGKRQIKISLIFAWLWFVISIVYYGLSFGAASLAGSLYLNIFLLAVLELPPVFSSFYFNNKIGRKWTCIICLSMVALSSCGCLIVQCVVDAESRGTWITVLCLVAKMFMGTASSVSRTWNMELHPTVIRSLGFGLCMTAARIGGILCPIAIDLEERPLVAFIFMTSVLVGAALLALFAPDTKGKLLPDSIVNKSKVIQPPNGNTGKGDNHENGKILKYDIDDEEEYDSEDYNMIDLDEVKPINADDSSRIVNNDV